MNTQTVRRGFFEGSGEAVVQRDSDEKSYACTVPRGSRTCTTPMINDAGVTSYAMGTVFEPTYASPSWSRTGSF